jgi:glutathione reductase (NADPH)
MEAIKFDVFVIGAGSAGQAVAQNCAKSGLKVGITERKLYGGTCPLRGCDPKKLLLSATEVIEMSKNMQGNGILKQPTISWKAMQKFKNKFTKEVPKASENGLIAAGITTYKEEASFINENTLALGSTVIETKHIKTVAR